MSHKLLLIDFENVQQVDLSHLDDDAHVIIFVGAAQKSIPIDLAIAAQQLGPRLEWRKVEGNGGNALDFHIACHLGRVLEKSPELHCSILSKDKGYDPLLRQLNKSGLQCRRIDSLPEFHARPTLNPAPHPAMPQPAPADDPNYDRVLEKLGKSEKIARPRKRATLANHVSAILQKQVAQPEINRIINKLIANKMISEANNAISYRF